VVVNPEEFNDITSRILGAAIEVHRILGPGLMESVYATCLHDELTSRGVRFVVQHSVPIVF